VEGQKKEEGKPIEIEGVKEWEIEKILNQKRSGQVFSMMEGVYSRT